MLTKNEIEKRLERDEKLYTRLSKKRKTIYQRMKRYRNMLYHLTKMEEDLAENSVCD